MLRTYNLNPDSFKHIVSCLDSFVSLHVFVYFVKEMTQMSITVLVTRRRMD